MVLGGWFFFLEDGATGGSIEYKYYWIIEREREVRSRGEEDVGGMRRGGEIEEVREDR